MFPTDPIRNYINLSFAKKIDEVARTYGMEVTAARLKMQGPQWDANPRDWHAAGHRFPAKRTRRFLAPDRS